jgi:hypothetical protein
LDKEDGDHRSSKWSGILRGSTLLIQNGGGIIIVLISQQIVLYETIKIGIITRGQLGLPNYYNIEMVSNSAQEYSNIIHWIHQH